MYFKKFKFREIHKNFYNFYLKDGLNYNELNINNF